MEHLKFFDLPSDPFQNESDERFYYESAPQKRARLRLVRGIHQRKALSVLVGGPGLGKTTLAHSLLRALDPREFAAHYLSIPHEACASGWFLPNVARAFGVHAPSAQIQTLVDQLHAQLAAIAASRRSAVLLVDEAQLFRNRDAMEEFRGLLNLLQDGRKLVSLVLFGLHELGEILRLDPPLAQRVEIRVELTAMDWLESQAYVSHRLRLAGASQAVFSPDALEALYRWSGGVPRVLNTLADNALFEAFLSESKPVDSSIVAAAAEALGLTPTPISDPTPSMPTLPPMAAAAEISDPAIAPADWLEPLSPMPSDVPDLMAANTTRVVAEDTSPSLEAAVLETDEPEPPMHAAEAVELELDEVLVAEPEPAIEVEIETAPEPAPEPEPEDSDWSLGSLVREADDVPMTDEQRRRNEDSFDLRSLALEVDAEPSPAPVPSRPAAVAATAPSPLAETVVAPAKDEDDLDALFNEIQISD